MVCSQPYGQVDNQRFCDWFCSVFVCSEQTFTTNFTLERKFDYKADVAQVVCSQIWAQVRSVQFQGQVQMQTGWYAYKLTTNFASNPNLDYKWFCSLFQFVVNLFKISQRPSSVIYQQEATYLQIMDMHFACARILSRSKLGQKTGKIPLYLQIQTSYQRMDFRFVIGGLKNPQNMPQNIGFGKEF